MSAIEVVVIMANIMQGEAAILGDDAMLAVGNVYLNRLNHPLHPWGITALDVASGFHGFNTDAEVSPHVLELASQVWMSRLSHNMLADPTWGSYYILSQQDIENHWGDQSTCIFYSAIWRSLVKFHDGLMYRLYAYRVWPTNIIAGASAAYDACLARSAN